MRNFKKFLALVLAMLMVSACAVSVSAFDDVADTDDYAAAIELLTNLGVIKGRDDGTNNFYPNETLTREEAAVIAAKILAGAKSVEWTAATTRFTDVADAWSFAYINYVDNENVMIGNDNGTFNPKGTLQIDEAIKIALAIADAKASFNASVEMAKNPSLPWWTHYVSEANKIGVTDMTGTIRNYQAKCTRGMFAQLIANAFNYSDEIQENFGYDKIEATVKTVTDSVVLLDTVDPKETDVKVAVELFNAALAANGIEKTAAELKGCNVDFVWTKVDGVVSISKVELLSNVDIYTHDDSFLTLYKKDNAVQAGKLSIDGKVYEVGVDDATASDGVLGGTSTTTYGVELKIDAKNYAAGEDITVPSYYKAYAYDDDQDGELDRIIVNEYAVSYIGKTDKGLYTIDGAVVTGHTDKIPVIWTSNAVPASDKIPALVQVVYGLDDAEKNVVVDILEVAAEASGTFSTYSNNFDTKYVKVGGTTYNYAPAGYVELTKAETDLIGLTATIYTLGGKYVKFVESSFGTFDMIVDSADIVDGKVVVSGYKTGSFAAVTETLDGYYDDTYYRRAYATKWYTDKDSSGNDYNTVLSLGTIKDGAYKDEIVKLTEGLVITIAKTADATYYKAEGTQITPTEAGKLKVAGKYFYLEGTAVMALADNFNILAEVKNVKDKEETGKYSDITYATSTAFAEMAEVDYAITTKDGKLESLFVKHGSKTIKAYSVTKSLAEGQIIVYVHQGATNVEVSYDASTYTYDVIDLFNKSVITITSDKAMEVGDFYIVKDNKMVDSAGNWISGNWTAYVKEEGLNGLIKTIKARGVAKVTNNVDDKYAEFFQAEKVVIDGTEVKLTDEAVYDMSNTVVFDADALFNPDDKALTPVDTSTVEKLAAAVTANAGKADTYVFADGARLIIVTNVG